MSAVLEPDISVTYETTEGWTTNDGMDGVCVEIFDDADIPASFLEALTEWKEGRLEDFDDM